MLGQKIYKLLDHFLKKWAGKLLFDMQPKLKQPKEQTTNFLPRYGPA